MVTAIIHLEDSSKQKIIENYLISIINEKGKKVFSHKDKFTGNFNDGLTINQWKNKILSKIREDFFISNDSIDLLETVLQKFVSDGLLTVREKETQVRLYG